MGETGYYLLWEHHQQQGLLQSRDVGRRCFLNGYARRWLIGCDPFPNGYFDLWDIYEEYAKPTHDLSYLYTPEVNEKRRNTMERIGFTGEHLQTEEIRNRSAEGRRNFWKSERSLELREQFRNRRPSRARRIEIQFSNGRVGTYSTVRMASIALGVHVSTVDSWIRGKKRPSGAFKGLKIKVVE
jgi:hypothetical protein